MSNVSKRRKEGSRTKIKVGGRKVDSCVANKCRDYTYTAQSVGDHKDFLNRITKTLYYGQLPTLPCLSLPVTEISCAAWSEAGRGRSVRRLHADAAADVARQACVSPCALVLALLYLERLNQCNKDYLANMHPQDLFLVSLMVGNKFLQDDGEDDEVICSEWAASGGLELKQLKKLEIEFLNAIEWNIFVSGKSFEMGLRRLERAVALRQARARGFFTYADLAAASEGGAELVRAAAVACAVLSLSYLTGLLALLTSTLVVSHAWLPALQLAARSTPLVPAPAPTATARAALYPSNATLELTVDALAADLLASALLSDRIEAAERLRCCAGWARFSEPQPLPPVRVDTAERDRWAEPWRSKTSLWNWLYRSSLVDPMQRWLERIDEYAELVGRGWSARGEAAAGVVGRAWLDLSGLTALVAAASDR